MGGWPKNCPQIKNHNNNNNTISCSGACTKSRAELHTDAAHGVGAKGKLDVAGANEPGLAIDSPTMPGIGENHTHRSQGSLCKSVASRFVELMT